MNALVKQAARFIMAFGLVVGSLTTAAPAHAAPLSCNGAIVDIFGGRTYVVHSCSGTGTVQYTADCLIGSDIVFSKGWAPPGGTRTFAFNCPLNSYIGTVSYKVIG